MTVNASASDVHLAHADVHGALVRADANGCGAPRVGHRGCAGGAHPHAYGRVRVQPLHGCARDRATQTNAAQRLPTSKYLLWPASRCLSGCRGKSGAKVCETKVSFV